MCRTCSAVSILPRQTTPRKPENSRRLCRTYLLSIGCAAVPSKRQPRRKMRRTRSGPAPAQASLPRLSGLRIVFENQHPFHRAPIPCNGDHTIGREGRPASRAKQNTPAIGLLSQQREGRAASNDTQLNYRCHCPPAGSGGMAGTVVYGIHYVAWRLPRNRKLNINSYSSIVWRYHLTGWTGAVRALAAAPAATGSMPPTATHRQPQRSGLSRGSRPIPAATAAPGFAGRLHTHSMIDYRLQQEVLD